MGLEKMTDEGIEAWLPSIDESYFFGTDRKSDPFSRFGLHKGGIVEVAVRYMTGKSELKNFKVISINRKTKRIGLELIEKTK